MPGARAAEQRPVESQLKPSRHGRLCLRLRRPYAFRVVQPKQGTFGQEKFAEKDSARGPPQVFGLPELQPPRREVGQLELHKAMEAYRLPKLLVGTATVRGAVPKRLAPIFRDREELASATDLGASINEALRNSACQIVICSPSAARSRWVNEEILAFKRLGREDRIFCFIVDGEPNASDDPSRAAQECFPPALRYRLGADGDLSIDVRTEPIAADARAGKDGRGNGETEADRRDAGGALGRPAATRAAARPAATVRHRFGGARRHGGDQRTGHRRAHCPRHRAAADRHRQARS